MIVTTTCSKFPSADSSRNFDSWTAVCFITRCTFATAARVYGQYGSFTTGTADLGGISADSLDTPWGVGRDATGVYIVDRNNNRVLFFAGDSTTATRVYGQSGSFSSNTANNGGLSASSLNGPLTLATDATGLYVCDQGNHRVLFYQGTSTTATRVYGQLGNFNTGIANNGGVSANGLWLPYGAATDSTGVYIADRGNNRVLFYPGTSTTATRVYGQFGNFTTGTQNNGGVSANSLAEPYAVAPSSDGVYISERLNHRITFYPGTSTTATRVYGQLDNFATNTANVNGVTAGSLQFPISVQSASNGLFVNDSGNSRVLIFNGNSTTASRVYGQQWNFTSNDVNRGGITAESLAQPGQVYANLFEVFIADRQNNRVLLYYQ